MKTKCILIFFLLMTFLSLPSVVEAQDMKQADKYFNNFEFANALEAYKKILENSEPNLAVVQRIADCYRIMNNSEEAEFWYAQAVNFQGSDPANLYFYAESAKRNGNYQKAKQLFEKYGQITPTQAAMALRMAASCDTAMAWIRKPSQSIALTINKSLNSPGGGFGPARVKDGLLFASDRLEEAKNADGQVYGWTGNGYIQMYLAKTLTDSTWAKPMLLPKSVNTTYHNGPGSFLEQEQVLYFTRTHVIKRSASKVNPDPTNWFKGAEGGTRTNRLGIYTAERKGEKWNDVNPFIHNNNSEYSVGHPAVTPDGKLLYFASDMPGGFGETDIYFCERQPDGSWGKPQNAGKGINMAGRESFPSVGEDGVLYFSSDGHLGMGSQDIFKAMGPVKAWTKAENLKYPLNSSRDDFGILMDSSGKSGLLSSNRENNVDNIFTFKEVYIPCTLTGRTVERIAVKGTSKRKEVPIDRVLLQLFEEGSETPVETYSDKNGDFVFVVKAGTNYIIKGKKPKYLTQTLAMTPDCRFNTDSVKVEMIFNRDTPNKPIVLDNIYYNVDKTDITAQAARELDKMVQTLIDNPNIRIELSSHTDSRQSNRYNEMLSQLRAQSAVDYIISKGIDRDRLVAKGYGETQLINKCKDGVSCSENQHQENRRTEFKILK